MARNLIGTVTLSICCERNIDISSSSDPCTSESFFILDTIENSTTLSIIDPMIAVAASRLNGNSAVRQSHGGIMSQKTDATVLNG
eukprot:5687286-Prymnesium_polylepis.1